MRSLDGRRSSVLVLTALAILAFLTYFYVSPPGNQERVTNENVDYLYRDVTRSKDGVLYMAFYFPQYHIAPENKVELEVEHYTDWDVLKKNSNVSSLTPPVFYNLADPKVLEEQDELASQFGVGVFIFYHYWLNNSLVLNHPVDLFLQRKRKTKFMFCWDNTSGFLGKQLYDSPEKHGYQLLRFFLNENYVTDVDGRKPFVVYVTNEDQLQERYTDADYLARLLSFLESHGVRLKLGHVYAQHMNYWALPAWSEIAVEFGPHMGTDATEHRLTTLYTYEPRNPTWAAGKEYWQGVTTSWDSRPRCSSMRTRQTACDLSSSNGLVSPDGFREVVKQVKNSFHPMNKDRVVTIFAWNEWAEGAALEPSVEYGQTFLECL